MDRDKEKRRNVHPVGNGKGEREESGEKQSKVLDGKEERGRMHGRDSRRQGREAKGLGRGKTAQGQPGGWMNRQESQLPG